jgi:hypothetical protein
MVVVPVHKVGYAVYTDRMRASVVSSGILSPQRRATTPWPQEGRGTPQRCCYPRLAVRTYFTCGTAQARSGQARFEGGEGRSRTGRGPGRSAGKSPVVGPGSVQLQLDWTGLDWRDGSCSRRGSKLHRHCVCVCERERCLLSFYQAR